jgi:hypothetical protein
MNCTQEIRALLRAHSDGMTIEQVVWAVKRDKANVKKTIRAMPDAYIEDGKLFRENSMQLCGAWLYHQKIVLDRRT